MDPNAKNNGKWKAWRELGYDIEGDRQEQPTMSCASCGRGSGLAG
jgi:hypothetical protein